MHHLTITQHASTHTHTKRNKTEGGQVQKYVPTMFNRYLGGSQVNPTSRLAYLLPPAKWRFLFPFPSSSIVETLSLEQPWSKEELARGLWQEEMDSTSTPPKLLQSHTRESHYKSPKKVSDTISGLPLRYIYPLKFDL